MYKLKLECRRMEVYEIKVKRLNDIALLNKSSQSYGTSFAI